MKIRNLFVALTSLMLLAACGTPKNIIYFEDLTQEAEKISEVEIRDIPLTYDDNLFIYVSAIDPVTVSAFNLPLANSVGIGTTEINTTPSIETYRVMSDGTINFPVLGKIHVVGRTQYEVEQLLTEKISVYADRPIVKVQLASSRIVVMGEVAHPGTYYFGENRYSILDALGAAGDLTINGRRDNILLIREEDGKRITHHYDLTSADILDSPYFYLKQHDVIYVQPNKAKLRNSNFSQSNQFSISVTSTIVSTVSVIISLVLALSK